MQHLCAVSLQMRSMGSLSILFAIVFFGIPLNRITASLFEADQPTNATLMTQLARVEIPPSVTTIELVFYLEVQQDASRKMRPGTNHAA